MSRPVVVLADDRTGALETAGALARRGRPVPVVPWPEAIPVRIDGGPVVVDLATRHLTAAAAAERVDQVLATAPLADATVLLKLDSTLRGNWAHELRASLERRGGRAMIVAAFPAVGRVCVDGIVLEHGCPVAEGPAGRDPRTPIATSRVSDFLAMTGVEPPASVATPDAARRWCEAGSERIAVCDAADDAMLAELGRVWSGADGVVFAGTGASVAAAVDSLGAGSVGAAGAAPPPVLLSPALVAVGSMHPVARAQARRLGERGWTIEEPGHRPAVVGERHVVWTAANITVDRGDEPAAELGETIGRHLRTGGWRTVVVVGGDTAAAVIGAQVVEIGGLFAPGVPWGRPLGSELVLVAKPGGFGDADTIAELFDGAP